MLMLFRKFFLFCLCSFVIACQSPHYSHDDKNKIKPVKILSQLEGLAKPTRKISIAVYDFPDLTGAFKSNDTFAVYSKAVPQGADTIVIDALLTAGNGNWFNVLERKGLNSLVQERKISEVNHNIRRQSQENSKNLLNSLQKSLTEKNVNFKINNNNNLGSIPTNTNNPLRINQEANFGLNQQNQQPHQNIPQSIPTNIIGGNKLLENAEYIIQGGIVGYDSDEITSGGGIRLLNIGGFGEIRKDIMTVNIRLVEVSTGNIVLNKTLSKGIYSQKIQGASFGYIDVDKILETEIGFSHNEPVFEALNLTIQTAVLEIIKQGIKKNLWRYDDSGQNAVIKSVQSQQSLRSAFLEKSAEQTILRQFSKISMRPKLHALPR